MIKRFEDLKIWQKAHSLALEIYKISYRFPEEEKFGLVSQIRRSSLSIGANIAEGYGRYHKAEYIHFY
jgi:four helix bundle protein